MQREIIQIDENKCNGCGLCITACHEGALALIDGKARLVKDSWCDGLGACLPDCPTGAISVVRREADAFDEQAVAVKQQAPAAMSGSDPRSGRDVAEPVSELRQWPVQIKLVPAGAPFLNGASLLIAADCAAYARAGFHRDFIRGRVTLIGCPKLDSGDYAEKLAQIFRLNAIKSIMVVRMEVPCCGGLEHAVRKALQASRKTIPLQVVILSADGMIVDA